MEEFVMQYCRLVCSCVCVCLSVCVSVFVTASHLRPSLIFVSNWTSNTKILRTYLCTLVSSSVYHCLQLPPTLLVESRKGFTRVGSTLARKHKTTEEMAGNDKRTSLQHCITYCHCKNICKVLAPG
jgi:hypothetical protein